jgi:adenylate kinase
MNKKAIMVLGPPGSGKGTQAKLLAEKFGFFHFITSQVGKDYIATHSDPETQEQMELYKTGFLFETVWLTKVVKEKTQDIFNKYPGIVYDGSPRTPYEAEYFYEFLSELIGKENIKIIEINVREEELKKRLVKRLVCGENSEHIFIRSEKLKTGDSCPEGDGVLGERDLDKKELFNTRMSEYKNETLVGLDFLKRNHPVIVVDGEQSIENVYQDIIKSLDL